MKEKETKQKGSWGGARPGAGRKVRGAEGKLDSQVVMRISETTNKRIHALREATKHDDLPFNRMFEKWVKELADAYGID